MVDIVDILQKLLDEADEAEAVNRTGLAALMRVAAVHLGRLHHLVDDDAPPWEPNRELGD